MQETDDLLIQAPHRALLEVHGPDAEDFLHRMATASVKTLPKISEPGKAVDLRPTLFLKGDGRLVANCWICRSAQPNSFLITTEAASRQDLLQYLDKFIIMEKVELRDLSNSYSCYDEIPAFYRTGDLPQPDNYAKYVELTNGHCFNLMKYPHTASRWEYWLIDRPEITALQHEFTSRMSKPVAIGSADDYNHLRIRVGEPAWGAELGPGTIPLEAGLKHAIDFSKGCFPGQEIVARIENLGHPANLLVGLHCGEPLPVGESLLADGKQIGRITSSVQMGSIYMALAYVKWDYREPGTRLFVAMQDGAAAVVHSLPWNPS